MSNMLLQRPLDQKLENSALEEIILQQCRSKTRLEIVYTVLVKKSNHFNCPFVGWKRSYSHERQNAKSLEQFKD